MTSQLHSDLEQILGLSVAGLHPMTGGSVATVYEVKLTNGSHIAAKVDRSSPKTLELEAWMLNYLKDNSDLPVPDVIYTSNGLLLLTLLPGSSVFPDGPQRHAAELLASLHNISSLKYGFEIDTLIGSLHQPNTQCDSWLEFFSEHRLKFMAKEAFNAGCLPEQLLNNILSFSDNLDRWLLYPNPPGLIHGDAWTGNILSNNGKITGFLDPAIYYADPEVELSFTTLFGTFGEPFFERYREIRAIEPGFFEERRDIYNLYPLLVHVRLFGGSYVDSVVRTMRKFGY